MKRKFNNFHKIVRVLHSTFHYLYRFVYEAVVRPGPGTRDDRDKKPIVIIPAKSPPILVHPNQIGGAMSAGEIFNIGVRLKTSQVSLKREKF